MVAMVMRLVLMFKIETVDWRFFLLVIFCTKIGTKVHGVLLCLVHANFLD
jgi:hypothetical protein